jgi:predicted nucleic acid-binding protein
MLHEPEILVFDTGPLSHLAKQGLLEMLRHVLGPRLAVITDTVAAELRAGVGQYEYLKLVLDASWIERRELLSEREIMEFARFSAFLVSGERNWGEAGVLAFAKAHDAIAIIDDGPARAAARRYGVRCQGTLRLLCDAYNEGQLSASVISEIADDLIAGEYRLPFKPGGFLAWAREHGLLLGGAERERRDRVD